MILAATRCEMDPAYLVNVCVFVCVGAGVLARVRRSKTVDTEMKMEVCYFYGIVVRFSEVICMHVRG